MDALEKHINLNNLAQEAVEEYLNSDDKEAWAEKYEDLYRNCTYGPLGLPRIASANLNGISFPSIRKFVTYYECRPD